MAEVPASFAGRLQRAREQAGLSQYALAKRAGITKQAINRLESGDNAPNWETVQRLALALGVTCQAFTESRITLPVEAPAPKRGRPARAEVKPETKPNVRKKK